MSNGISSDYFDRFCRHLGTLDGFEFDRVSEGVRSAITPTLDLWATPGWEGLPGLPWSTEENGDVPDVGDEPVQWTGDLDKDAELYRSAVARIVARLG